MQQQWVAIAPILLRDGIFIGTTMFCQKDKFKTTWMHHGPKQWHLMDYVLVRNCDFCSVRERSAKMQGCRAFLSGWCPMHFRGL